ncbi:MAG: acyl-CoA thioesterase, partial [Candidatus Omnitrophica bacterium]|nr:acyl-CoA thioesterase [Candidatus Omnitrophota bacterium]
MSADSFNCPIRVRYAETDQMGVTYYGSYFVWFEVARTEYFRNKGIVYTEMEKNGIFLAVVECRCRYVAPSRYDDELVVCTSVAKLGDTSIHFAYGVSEKKSNGKIAEGSSVHVFVNRNIQPIRMPEEVLRAFG